MSFLTIDLCLFQFDLFPSGVAFVEVRYLEESTQQLETRGVYVAVEGVPRAIRQVKEQFLSRVCVVHSQDCCSVDRGQLSVDAPRLLAAR